MEFWFRLARMKRFTLLVCALLPSRAYLPRPASSPVKVLVSGTPSGNDIIVFLPGRWSLLKEFDKEGFFETARKNWPDARFVVPDLHLGYHKNNTVTLRLHEDVILPAKKSCVKTTRFVGISMGGLGALIYDIEHPGEVDEMYLLAAFLGEEEAISEITTAGSLAKWNPSDVATKDFSRRLWIGLRSQWMEKGNRPVVHLGCDTEDRLSPSAKLSPGSSSRKKIRHGCPAHTTGRPGAPSSRRWSENTEASPTVSRPGRIRRHQAISPQASSPHSRKTSPVTWRSQPPCRPSSGSRRVPRV
jgi:pimeloyl-ACP methyl ester carboxylesterase